MSRQRIDSPDDPRLRSFREVTDPKRIREGGAFVAEGRRVVTELLLREAWSLRELLVTEAALEALNAEGARLPETLPVYVVRSPSVLRALTGVRFHQGCIALADLPPSLSVQDVVRGQDLVVVLEGVTDPDNVGTIFRTARAFGAGGVILAGGCAHPLYRKAIRTSLGNTLRVPFAFDAPWPAALDRVAEAGLCRIALTPAADAEPLAAAAAHVGDGGVALMLGSEAEGLSGDALDRAERRVRIPLLDAVDSLNVAAAAAIALDRFARVG